MTLTTLILIGMVMSTIKSLIRLPVITALFQFLEPLFFTMKKWTTNELDPNVLDHASINITGAYSLQVSADGESFTESYDYLNDLYDQETQTRYEKLSILCKDESH